MPVRTAKGTALARRVEGFRRFIKTAAVAQAHPAGQPDTLYDYLPYAIAFGCTKEWADLTGSLTHTGQAPSWYQSQRAIHPGQPGLAAAVQLLLLLHPLLRNLDEQLDSNHRIGRSGQWRHRRRLRGGGGGGGGVGSW